MAENTGSPDITDTVPNTVNEIISEKLVKHEDGTYGGLKEVDGKQVPIKLGEALKQLNLSEDKALAVTAEVRRRGTERAFTEINKAKIELEAELEVYKSLVPTDLNISAEKQEQLDVLKYENPDKWFEEMSALKAELQNSFKEQTEKAISEAKQQALVNDSIEARSKTLEEFNASVSTPLTDEQLQFDIPPRLLKQVESGDLTFKEMLHKAHEYINGPKRVTNPDMVDEPSFNHTPGGINPNKASGVDIAKSYENIKL